MMNSTPRRRILLYGDVNLNIIDGSSIWLTSIAAALAQTSSTVDVLLKAAEENDRLTQALRRLPHVNVISDKAVSDLEAEYSPRRAAQRIVALDATHDYDAIISRGLKISLALARGGRVDGRLWPYMTDLPHSRELISDSLRDMVDVVAGAAARVFAQTEEARSFLEETFPQVAGKVQLLWPMIPDELEGRHENEITGPLRLVYSGKMAKAWRTLEMCDIPRRMRERGVDVQVTFVGDKIQQDVKDPTWHVRMASALNESFGVSWQGGMPREEALREMSRHDVGLSWRDEVLDSSHELSTKLLEYLAIGVPPLLNRTSMHAGLVGDTYPLFVSDDSVEDVIAMIASKRSLLSEISREARARASRFRISAAAGRLEDALGRAGVTRRGGSVGERTRVLVAGHDFKFLGELIDSLRADPRIELTFDKWTSLHTHDVAESRRLVDSADVIFCEWAGPNAVWYSREKRARQRLIVRLHAFELRGGWLNDIDVSAVDHLVCVSENYADLAASALAVDRARVLVLPNMVDSHDLERPKDRSARFHLALIGLVPILKRPDRAISLLRRLLSEDDRYTLHLRGRLPNAYPWEWAKPADRAYYQNLYGELVADPVLRRHVAVEPFGSDVANWLTKIGWVLSPSAQESFHLAPVEGMASGAVPLVWSRPGAEEIFGRGWTFESEAQMAEYVLTTNREEGAWSKASARAALHAERYDSSTQSGSYISLILGLDAEVDTK